MTPSEALRLVAQHRRIQDTIPAPDCPLRPGWPPTADHQPTRIEAAAYVLADSVQALTAEVAMLRADRARLADRLREQGHTITGLTVQRARWRAGRRWGRRAA